jgi:hypothetical protein
MVVTTSVSSAVVNAATEASASVRVFCGVGGWVSCGTVSFLLIVGGRAGHERVGAEGARAGSTWGRADPARVTR